MAGELSYSAVLLASVASFFLGWLWYGPFFGRTWAKENNLNTKTKPEMPLSKLVYHFITTLMLATAMALLVGNSFSIGLITSLIIWLGFFVSTRLSSMIWMEQSWTLFWIDMTYHLINLILIISVLSLF